MANPKLPDRFIQKEEPEEVANEAQLIRLRARDDKRIARDARRVRKTPKS